MSFRKRLHDEVLQRPNKLFTFAAFFKKVTMTTAEERYEETWNNYLVLLNKDPNVSLASFTKSKNVYHRGSAKALVSFLSLYRKGGEPCLG